MMKSTPPPPPSPVGGPPGVGAAAVPAKGLAHGMIAFRTRDYRVFWPAALLSNTGSWIQTATIPFVINQLTGSALWAVGFSLMSQFLPATVFGSVGGWLADRHERRNVLLVTQSAMAAVALAIWLVWTSGVRSPVALLALNTLTGVIAGMNIPAWQSFVPSLVPREHMLSAVTLNSTQFNAARALGPAIAGVLIATVGPGLAFLVNAISYLVVIGALLAIPPRPIEGHPPQGSLLAQMSDAFFYIRRNRGIALSILIVILVAGLGNPIQAFTTVFASDIYNVGSTGYGILTTSIGVGAIAGAPFLSGWGDVIPRGRLVAYSLVLYGAAVTAFGQSRIFPVGMITLAFAGMGFLAVVSATNTAVQLQVEDSKRGRVMALRIMGFTAAFPIGGLIQGAVADVIGPELTVTIAGVMLTAVAIWLFVRPELMSALDSEEAIDN